MARTPGIYKRIKRNGEVSWQAKVRNPEKPHNWISQTFTRKIDAEKWLRETKRDLERNEWIDPSKSSRSFESYANEWLANRTVKPQTHARYETVLRLHLIPVFGKMQLRALSTSFIKQWAKQLHSDHALSSAHFIYMELGQILTSAVEDGYLLKSPIPSSNPLPKKSSEPRTIRVLSDEDIDLVVANVPDRLKAFVRLLAATGMRQGEALALTIQSIDWLRKSVRVDSQVVCLNGEQPKVVRYTKTNRGSRVIPLNDLTIEVLSQHIQRFGTGDHELIFPGLNKQPAREATVVHALASASKKTGIKVTAHTFRHTFASRLLASGTDPNTAARLLGHSVGTLLSTYSHALPDVDARARAAIDGLHAVRFAPGSAARTSGSDRTI